MILETLITNIYNSVQQQTYIQYTRRTTLNIIHDTNWIQEWSRGINILCQLVIPSDFFNIFFRTLIMNIDCEKNYRKSGQQHRWLYWLCTENYDTGIHPTDFLWNVNWWKKNCEQWYFFSVTNIRTNVQNDSSEF